MNEKLLEIYDKCMKHNISISMQFMLSDAVIEVTGETLAYDTRAKKYKILKNEKWVRIHEMKEVIGVDLVVLAIDEIFNNLNNRKNELKGKDDRNESS